MKMAMFLLQRSLRHIEKMNGLRSSQESAYYGLTEFSDMSEDEFLTLTLLSDLPARGGYLVHGKQFEYLLLI